MARQGILSSKHKDMAKLIQLGGLFQRKGKKLVNESVTLLISERTQTTEHKTRYFLISLRGNQKDSYISSLYELSENRYWLEYRGQVYTLQLDEETASISLKETSETA